MQPFLLELYGDKSAYGIAGLAAAIVASAQIVGGITASQIRKFFQRRTTVFIISVVITACILFIIGLTINFWVAIALLVLWGLVYAATSPVRQAYLNALIPSKERATLLSFDSLIGSTGGIVIQPILGRAADVWSYAFSYLLGAGISLLALPFLFIARHENTPADKLDSK